MALGHPRSMAFHRTTPGGAGSERKEWPGVASASFCICLEKNRIDLI